MKMPMLAGLALAAAAVAAPAHAQRSSYVPGTYWDVSMIDVEDGQFENYMDWLKTEWVRQNEWFKKKGYIVDYHVLGNGYKRGTEPDLYLVVEYRDIPTPAQELKRHEEYVAFLGKDEHKLEEESGLRGKMRTRLGGMQLRELTFK